MRFRRSPGWIHGGDRFTDPRDFTNSPLCQIFPDFLFHISHLYAILNIIAVNSGKSIDI
ncbi:hypothetical protein GNF10_26750 [Nostoc sp. UCD121]|uniref:hypothetical protein n=1 Tax=Nostoc sp. UCD121 TaxID=2681305 RepID=UPI00162983C6|nr:hypothetical protein [Nostoc sp. UCD121]MBC1222896.1 hypothetical protein [Nostoc sp. UCD120]MBC1279459.1 hypothetical protein [Nostoc sp. UCD121]MBC1297216.1 hypothetical protein [Nostoc sp. UCD122]